jgi:hypothetical protein
MLLQGCMGTAADDYRVAPQLICFEPILHFAVPHSTWRWYFASEGPEEKIREPLKK